MLDAGKIESEWGSVSASRACECECEWLRSIIQDSHSHSHSRLYTPTPDSPLQLDLSRISHLLPLAPLHLIPHSIQPREPGFAHVDSARRGEALDAGKSACELRVRGIERERRVHAGLAAEIH